MSRRTSEAIRAVAAAWSNEQQLVNEGKGTRDWTAAQQQDILEKGKAYDDNGKAFEGHHMKSAEKYPEYQGNPQNIQFLTRQEHFEAHGGNFQNPTNGYFDPITKLTKEFDADGVESCTVVDLSEPVINNNVTVFDYDPDTSPKEREPDDSSCKEPPEKKKNIEDGISQKSNTTKSPTSKLLINSNNSGGFKQFIGKTAKGVLKFCSDHKEGIGLVVGAIVAVVPAVIEALSSGGGSNGGSSTSGNNTYSPADEDEYSGSFVETSSEDDASDPVERSSPGEHTVKGHGQHYHTKEGLIWKEKEPYPRGGKKDE